MDRRHFIRNVAVGTGLAASQGMWSAFATNKAVQNDAAGLPLIKDPGTRQGDMLYRTLGRTGEKVSAIGMGGFHIGHVKDERSSMKLVRAAIDRGITFMDNSWDYNDGRSEEWMGKALRDGYRQKVFLMTKFDGRTKQSAAQQIEESLKRLQTDHLDLIQVHEVIRMED
ncbi:MAG TPA: aldo/keto reductase, partial [Terriglobales bacterium]|nr:aldo/keto reductase [Terriglobales bacterium]